MTVEMTRKVAAFDAHFRGISALGVAALSLFIGAWDDLQTGLAQYHSRLLVRSPVQEVYSYISIGTSTIGLSCSCIHRAPFTGDTGNQYLTSSSIL